MPLTHPSPNFGARRGGVRPRLVVIHYTAMADAEAALARLCDPAAEVSAHWLIAADGTVCSLVREEDRAWHAGAGAWGGVEDVNSASVGIELDNDGASPFPERQMDALEGLLDEIMDRWDIPARGVIGHQDMAPGRKADPGLRFDWRRLALAGRAVWPGAGAVAADPAGFTAALAAFGYPQTAAPDTLLAAFRARFGGGPGPLDDRDMGRARDLARRFAVDPGGQGA